MDIENYRLGFRPSEEDFLDTVVIFRSDRGLESHNNLIVGLPITTSIRSALRPLPKKPCLMLSGFVTVQGYSRLGV